MVGEVDELEEDVGWSISCLKGVMVGEVDELEEELVDKPGTTIAICFTCNGQRKLLVEEVHDKFSQIFFEAILVQWLLALVVGRTRLILHEGLLELLLVLGTLPLVEVDLLRTWSPPINFNCPSAVFGIVTKLGEIISSRWALRCGILTRLFFVRLLKVCYHKSSFPNFSTRVPDEFGECFGQYCASELVEFQQRTR